MNNWINKEVGELTPENLRLLIGHKIPAISVKNFISQKSCQIIANKLKAMKFAGYDHLKDIPVQQLGLCHNQFAHEDKHIYFSKKREAIELVNNIYSGLGINPVEMVISALNDVHDGEVGIYAEEGYGEYFAGAFRSFRGHGKLHADHAPSHINADWEVTNLLNQLTWNIYYSMYQSGGELVIYDSIHTRENDSMKVENDYYFPYEVLENDECIKIVPEVGELIIFNTQNFHEILGNNTGQRISQTSFIGLTTDGDLNLWS